VPFVYILRCADDSYYVGSTWDLERRLSEHRLGLGAAYTRHRRPVTLVWAEEHPSVRECYRVEKQIQGWGRRKREALISGGWTSLTGLGSRASAARDRRA